MLNKVPEITVYFWVIKVLCTTVGETAADLLNENLGLGLTNTTYIMAALLIATLVFQFRTRKYVPGIYWLAVVLISIVGTLFSDNLVDNLGVPLQTTTIAFGAILALVFGARPSTGWRSSSPSRSAPRPGIWSPRSSNSATCPRWGSSPGRSLSSPSPISASS